MIRIILERHLGKRQDTTQIIGCGKIAYSFDKLEKELQEYVDRTVRQNLEALRFDDDEEMEKALSERKWI